MDRKLLIQGIAKVLAGVVLLGVLLFLPAGTLAWPQGWRLMVILFVPMFLAGIVMLFKNPELLKKRLLELVRSSVMSSPETDGPYLLNRTYTQSPSFTM